MSTTWLNVSTSSVPSARRNFMRLSDARLHAESSMLIYSAQGLDALIRPVFGFVCHWLIVVSYCTPGSAQRHAASAMSHQLARGDGITHRLARRAGDQPPVLVVLDGVHEVV